MWQVAGALLCGVPWHMSSWPLPRSSSHPCPLGWLPPTPVQAATGVGRLGIIYELTLRIVPQQAVKRTLQVRRRGARAAGSAAAAH